jgi:hypothetical protein
LIWGDHDKDLRVARVACRLKLLSLLLITIASSAIALPTATAAHHSMLKPGTSLPSEAECATAVGTSTNEYAPWNQDDGTNANGGKGWDSNKPPSEDLSYFHKYPSCCTELPATDFSNVDGNYSGTTDDLIRITACKWGIDEDYIRAQAWIESGWHQDCAAAHGGNGCAEGGDENSPAGCTPSSITGFPMQGVQTPPTLTTSGEFCDMEGFAGLSGTNQYDTWGIAQTKVYYEWATWPMIEESTPFSLDYRYAEMRGRVNGDQYGYFNSQNRKSGNDYLRAVSNAKSSPTGSSRVPGWNNLQYLAYGCIDTHFSGGWFNGRADSYLRGFLSTLNSTTPPWPGGQR